MRLRYAALVLGLSAVVQAGTITVNSTDEPWEPSLNPSYSFLNPSATAPAAVTAGLNFTAGGLIEITYVGGSDQTSPGEPFVDGVGYTFDEWDSTQPNGISGGTPADHIPSTPIYLQEVVGTFTDGAGDIVGTPFVVGDGTTVTVPVGASALQLGINDNYFTDNIDASAEQGGPLQFSVSNVGNETTQTPEPGTFALVGGALLAIGYRRSKRLA